MVLLTSRQARREAIAAYAFLAPALLLFVVFIAGPLLAAIGMSFLSWDLLTPATFAGLDNYRHFLDDAVARQSLLNTFVFTFWSIVLHIGIGLVLAIGVNRAMPAGLKYLIRTLYFFPFLISYAAVALVAQYILDPTFGFLNYYLHGIGIAAPSWLVSPGWAMPAIIGVDFWRTLGYTFIILLAGLQTIPHHLYEAAEIDGAPAFRRFLHITLPMLSPTLFFALVITFIGAFQIFDPMYIMTKGGPGVSTRSLVQDVYMTGFQSFQMGYASVLALLVFVVIMLVSALQLRLSRVWVHYGS